MSLSHFRVGFKTETGRLPLGLHSLSMSICRSLMLSTHCLTDSSLQTSSVSRDRVLPYVSPAASTNLSFLFRSRIVPMTEHTERERTSY